MAEHGKVGLGGMCKMALTLVMGALILGIVWAVLKFGLGIGFLVIIAEYSWLLVVIVAMIIGIVLIRLLRKI